MTSPVIGTPWKKLNAPVSEEALEGVDKYWRVANYLSIGQIYLRSNPLMKEPFTREDVKHRLVGHWGTTPGLNFLIGHINRFIADHGQNTVFIMGPGHGGPAGTSQSYLDGTYTETYPNITKDEAGLQKFFRQFSYPGGIPSHFAPETPGSIHAGVASWVTPCPTLMARSWTTRACSFPASSAMVRPRPARWPPAGSPTSS